MSAPVIDMIDWQFAEHDGDKRAIMAGYDQAYCRHCRHLRRRKVGIWCAKRDHDTDYGAACNFWEGRP